MLLPVASLDCLSAFLPFCLSAFLPFHPSIRLFLVREGPGKTQMSPLDASTLARWKHALLSNPPKQRKRLLEHSLLMD
jgi:hypothetical protein